jgi:hypothetical protein
VNDLYPDWTLNISNITIMLNDNSAFPIAWDTGVSDGTLYRWNPQGLKFAASLYPQDTKI